MAKVFVSSVFRGMEDFRSAVAAAIESLGHTPILAENFPGSSRSPQVACLAGVREADVVILLLGERYGPKQNLGLSATHEEYREAKERCTVIPFVQGNITFDDDQDAFAAEVRSWNGGHYSASFDGPEDLRKAATAALHRWELSQVAGSPNQSEMLERAIALLPQERQSYGRSSMAIALAGWPVQPVLRPSELEDQKMRRDLLKEALFGEAAVLTTMEGIEILLRDHGLLFRQKQRFFWIDEQGSVLLQLPLQMPD